jgi:hypothetical protein
MRVAVRKLRVEDVEKLQALVVENFDAIEPGLTVLDARLLLGHATIDVIGVDSVGALVLGNVGFSANEDMLLKAVEAYSWCLEYPEALVRLYPSCQLSDDRPPRLLFVVERMPDAFHRKIKQLGFPEVDCVEFRHLEFDGVPAVYFESLLRLRRGPAAVASRPAEIESPSEKVVSRTGAAPRATGVKLPRLGQPAADAPASGPRASERPVPASVVSMVSRQTAVPAPWADRPRASEPVLLREPEPLVIETVLEPVAAPEPEPVASLPEAVVVPDAVSGPEPVIVFEPVRVPEPVKLAEVPELTIRPAAVNAVPSMAPAHVPTAAREPERLSFKDLADSLLGAMTATHEALAQPAADTAAPAIVEPLVLESAVQAPAAIEPIVAPLELELPKELEPIAEPQPAVTPTALETMTASPAPATPERPAAETAKPAPPAMPQGFEGLKFPNDGVLTRQWMEFLSQMSTNK